VKNSLEARINLAAFRHNLKNAQKIVGQGVALLPVIKADGYGHGAPALAREALKFGVPMLGLGTLEEGINLRREKIAAPILLLDGIFKDQAAETIKYRLTPVIHSVETARELSRTAGREGKKIPVHLKFDTGMSRLGIGFKDAFPALTRVKRMKNLVIEGIMTHLASSPDRNSPQTELQLNRFRGIISMAKENGIEPRWIHSANSGGIMNFRESHFNMVRPGIMLYGAPPAKADGFSFKPVMRVTGRIISVKTVPSGEGVGYNATYTTPRPKKIGVVMGGYADGVNRRLSNRGFVVHHGAVLPIVGTVCMDNFMVDLSRADDARVGDYVTILGGDDDSTSAVHVAELAGTVPYEIFCNIGNRVKRVTKG